MSYSYTFRPSRWGRIAGARYRASQRVPYARRYGAFGPASRSRARRGYIPRGRRLFRPGFDRPVGALARTRFNPYASTPEVKNYDTYGMAGAMTTSLVTSSSVTTGMPLVGLTQGTSENERIGRKICVKQFTMTGIFEHAPTTGPGHDIACLYVILDTQCNGGAGGGLPALIADVTNTIADPEAMFLNLDNSMRFKVLKKIVHVFPPTTQAPGGLQYATNVWRFSYNFKMNMEVNYASSSGIISEIKDHNIFFVFGSLIGKCGWAANCRIRFTDA